MKITIDTSVDSKEDIRKAVALLSSLADGRHEHHSNIFENSSPSLGVSETSSSESSAGNAFANMFGDNSAMQSEDPKEERIGEEKKEVVPQIIQY